MHNPDELKRLADSADARAKWGLSQAGQDSKGTIRLLELIAAELRALAQQSERVDQDWLDAIESATKTVAEIYARQTARMAEFDILAARSATPDHVADASKKVPQQAGPAVDTLHIPRSPALDPIYCYFEDFDSGRGRMTIACFGDAWTGAWGAMGGRRKVRQFVAESDPDYLAASLLQMRKANKATRDYVGCIAVAVIAALAAPNTQEPQ